MFRPVLAAVLVALTASACAGKSRLKVGEQVDGEVVEAVGFAANNPKDLVATKRASLVDAQRNAVEKAVGVFISGRTRVEKAVAIENNILARTEGYVRKYDVLEEGTADDLYRTKIRALVALRELEADLRENSLLVAPEIKRPRVVVRLDEDIDRRPAEDHAAASALSQALVNQGFVVVDPDRSKDAEIEIRGKASAHPFQSEGLGGFVSYRARLTLQAIRAGTNSIVHSLSREASGLGGSDALAALKSLDTVGELAGNELALALPEIWSKGKNIVLRVENLAAFSDVEDVRKRLQSQPGVSDLILRTFEDNVAQFDVQLGATDLGSLAAALESSKEGGLKVIETQGQSIRLRKS